MALKLKWTIRAVQKFDRIIDYLLLEWDEIIAKSFVKKRF
jgi:plasmid stabilization system protein ParE